MRRTSVVLLVFVLLACGESKKSERPDTPRIKKETRIVLPKQNTRTTSGASVAFEFESKTVQIDSIVVEENGSSTRYLELSFEQRLTSKKVGSQRIKSTVYFSGKKETHHTKIIVLPLEAPVEYTYEIVNSYPHGTDDYTQGLLIDDGFLYEGTGQTGQSVLKKKTIETGETLQQLNLGDEFFGEGLAILNDKFYQLTYTSGACFVYNRDFEKIQTFRYEGEGWGLTEFNGNLLMTNRTEKMVVRDPATFAVIDELEVYDNKGKVDAVNELEVINGLIYANVYQEDLIVVIDPSTGAVLQKIDMTGLLAADEARNVDVLNGIAYDREK